MAPSKCWNASKAAVTRPAFALGPPAVLGWATGNLPEPRNNPQIGMANMRTVMPALQRAKPATLAANGLSLRLRQLAQTAARDPRGQGHQPRSDR